MRKLLFTAVSIPVLLLVIQCAQVYADQRSGEGQWVCWTLYPEDSVLVPFGIPHNGSIVTSYFQIYYGYVQVYATSVSASAPGAAPWCGHYPFDVQVIQGKVWYRDGSNEYPVGLTNTGCMTQPCTVATCHYSSDSFVLYLGAMHAYSTSMLKFGPECIPVWCSNTVSY